MSKSKNRATVGSRILALDSLRGLLISLVVFGHVIGAAYQLAVENGQGGCVCSCMAYLYKWIYLFHMSAFFFVSGVLFKEWCDFGAAVKKFALRLLVPYFCVGFLFLCIYILGSVTFMPKTEYYAAKFANMHVMELIGELLFGHALHYGESPFVYNAVLWFLPALFSANVLYAGIFKGLRRCFPGRRAASWVVLSVLLIVAWLVDTKCTIPLPYGLSRTVGYLPFFMLGNLLPVVPCVEALRRKPFRRWIWIPAFVVFSVIACSVPDLMCRYYSFAHYLAFVAVACLGIVMSLFLAVAMDSKIFGALGCASLSIMLFHKPIVVLLQFACPLIRVLFAKGVGLVLVGSFAVTVVAIACCLVADGMFRRFAPWIIGAPRSSR